MIQLASTLVFREFESNRETYICGTMYRLRRRATWGPYTLRESNRPSIKDTLDSLMGLKYKSIRLIERVKSTK